MEAEKARLQQTREAEAARAREEAKGRAAAATAAAMAEAEAKLRRETPPGVKVLPWVVEGAGGLGAGKTSGAGTRGVSLDVVIGGRTGYSNTNVTEARAATTEARSMLIVVRQKIPVYEEN